METAMRKTKREIIAAEASGDDDMLTAKSILLRRQKEEYANFSKAAGLLTQNERTQVYGFDKSIAQKAAWKARKAQKPLDNGGENDPWVYYIHTIITDSYYGDFDYHHLVVHSGEYYVQFSFNDSEDFNMAIAEAVLESVSILYVGSPVIPEADEYSE